MSEDRLANEELSSAEVPESDQDQAMAADLLTGDVELHEEGEPEAVAEPTLEDQLAEAEAKAAEYLDGWQRARAEFANARKRAERQRTEAYSSAAIDFGKRLLPVVDDLGRMPGSRVAALVFRHGGEFNRFDVQSVQEAFDNPFQVIKIKGGFFYLP